jgi:hypothetical protein
LRPLPIIFVNACNSISGIEASASVASIISALNTVEGLSKSSLNKHKQNKAFKRYELRVAESRLTKTFHTDPQEINAEDLGGLARIGPNFIHRDGALS